MAMTTEKEEKAIAMASQLERRAFAEFSQGHAGDAMANLERALVP